MTDKAQELYDIQMTLRDYGLTLPETNEEHPWKHIALKVRKKSFVFLLGAARKEAGFSVTVKLRESHANALALPFSKPAGYGLGKSGWVQAEFGIGDDRPPTEYLCDWILESYRIIAPKTLVKSL